ncbi:MAG: DNA-deoxyinosine glycosylase [Holosporales bacterium]|jgi:hypoxanthine-DNA glycosylase|nr:DNA-deoxyinosine glycosylase [Holosporales bacterium]
MATEERILKQMINHPFSPVFNEHSKILILGTFPSEKSREFGFYYGHPKNRFWRIIAYLTKTNPVPTTIKDKKQMLLKNGIALWDIVKSCDIKGSSDNTITNVVPNDLASLLEYSSIKRTFANGDKAYRLCRNYVVNATKLPSTSPANATYNFEKLLAKWSIILNKINSHPGKIH